MPNAHPLPTGRRRITDDQIKIKQRLTGRLDAVPLGRIRAAALGVAPAIGLSNGGVRLLSALLAYTQACDWEAGRLRFVYPSNDTLALTTKMTIRTVQRGLRELLDAGLIAAIDGGTGARRGVRDADGYIRAVSAAIDLSPLGERVRELELLRADYQATFEEVRRLKAEIGQERNHVLRLTDYAMEQTEDVTEWEEIASRARDMGAAKRDERDPTPLAARLGKLKALRVATEAKVFALKQLRKQVQEPVDKTPQGAKFDTPHTTTNQLNIAYAIAPGRLRLADEKGSGEGSRFTPAKGQSGPATESALRGFPATPHLILKIAPDFRDWAQSPTPSWADLADVADLVRSHLCISQHAWGQACIVLGRIEATCAIAAISAKNTAGLVRSPGGLLRHMVDAHPRGELRLDRTLFGLADGVGALGRRDAPAPRKKVAPATCRSNPPVSAGR